MISIERKNDVWVLVKEEVLVFKDFEINLLGELFYNEEN